MKFRRLRMDFSATRTHWSANPEFAQNQNAMSLIPVHVEPYLIKVMMRAKEQLGSEQAALKSDIDVFIQQESQHYKVHQQFNKNLHAAGYDRLPEFEKELAADYRRFLETKSLRFNCAYCEGFETMGPPNARAYFECYGDLLAGADPQAMDLWKWHMLEEYEHRDVAYRALHAVLGGNRVVAYFYRIWGLLAAMKHLGAWGNRVSAYLLKTDRRTMSDAALRASRSRERDFKRAMRKHYLPQLLRAFRPGYDPARDWPEPHGMREFMQRVEQQYAIPGRAE